MSWVCSFRGKCLVIFVLVQLSENISALLKNFDDTEGFVLMLVNMDSRFQAKGDNRFF